MDLDRRTFLSFSGVVAAGGLLAACGSARGGSTTGATTTTSVSKSIVVDSAAAPSSLNTFLVNDGSFRWLSEACLETLYRYDNDLKIVPLLAADLPKVSSDLLTYTIALRPGINFHNGAALDATEVVATLTEASKVGNWAGHLAGYFQYAKAIGLHTIEIRVKKPFGLFLDELVPIQIVHSSTLKSTTSMVGTGPFKQSDYVENSFLQMDQWSGYWGTKPAVQSIRFNFVTSPGVQLVNLKSGAADVITQLRATDYETAKATPGLIVTEANAPIDILWQYNFATGPFKDSKVRQALAYATDRSRVRDVIYGGQATLGQGPLGPAIQGYTELNIYPERADITKAKALLAQAGVADLQFNLIAPNLSQDLCTELQSQWKAAGITANLEVTEIGTWVQNWTTSKFDLSLFQTAEGFSVGTTPYLLVVLHTDNPLNFGKYSNPEFDDLVDRCFATSDITERAKLATQANKLIADAAAWTPPVYPKYLIAQRDSVPAFNPNQLRINRLRWQDLA